MRTHLQGHTVVLLDTCLWIYHLKGGSGYADLTTDLLTAVADGAHRAVISEITLLELLVHPYRLDQPEVADEYELLIDTFPNLTCLPVTRDITVRAAELRGRHGLQTPDAVILATGIAAGATLAVTNDAAWKRVEGLAVVCLQELLS